VKSNQIVSVLALIGSFVGFAFDVNADVNLNSQVPVKNQSLVTVSASPVSAAPKKDNLRLISFSKGDNKAEMTLKAATDCFYGDHAEMFSASPLDQTFSIRTVWDMIFDANLGSFSKTKLALRTRSTWGNENSIFGTSVDTFKVGDAVTGSHSHSIGRMTPWIREGWFDFSVNEAFGMQDHALHRIKIGAFPFSLGRGIALGSAYNAIPGFLGFCASNIIDQFPFGCLMSGDIVKKQLSYNICLEILENFADKFGRVNQIVYDNQFGEYGFPGGERGFAKINFIFATDLKWNLLDGSKNSGKLEVEPYLMYNFAPEQKVEFTADASSKLGTLGLCIDYSNGMFEFGVDIAKNLGSQNVRGWDRNGVDFFVDSDGVAKNKYTYVRRDSSSGPQAIQTAGAKQVVNSHRNEKGTTFNGQLIGTDTLGVSYYNDINRYRAPYNNAYQGLMLTSDWAISLRADKNLKLVGTVAWATGDENPNVDLENPNDSEQDGDYQGFIPMQSVYAGKRVRSLFVIGSNPIPRPGSTPSYSGQTVQTTRQTGFASPIGGFTNLAFIGGGFDWTTSVMSKVWRIEGSVLSYWQDKATKKFDIVRQQSSNEYASKHLGIEINSMARISMLDELSGYLQIGVFVPGQHYEDIKGTPLNKAQKAALNDIDDSGYPVTGTPVIGTSNALVLNWGLELCF
jgi:hypothetical protein